MFKTFNMGWGFAMVVPREEAEDAVQLLGGGAGIMGKVTSGEKIAISYGGKRMELAF